MTEAGGVGTAVTEVSAVEQELGHGVLVWGRLLVDHPEEVAVEVSGTVHATVIRLQVAKGDVGKIIGKRGTTVDAIRILLRAAGGKKRKRVELEVDGDESEEAARAALAAEEGSDVGEDGAEPGEGRGHASANG
jgi:predicted RNA-binding protein YlqC (UPF0109 family)